MPVSGQPLVQATDLLGEAYWTASMISPDRASVTNYAGYVVNLKYEGKLQDQVKALKTRL